MLGPAKFLSTIEMSFAPNGRVSEPVIMVDVASAGNRISTAARKAGPGHRCVQWLGI